MKMNIAGTGVTAEFDAWEMLPRSDTLLLWCHGMEDPAHEPHMIAPRALAFPVPFDRAMVNGGFTREENWGRLTYFVGAAQKHRSRFLTGQVPRLYIYPYLFEQSPPIPPCLEYLASRGQCDILYLTSLDGADYVTFRQFLDSRVPGEDVTFLQRYETFVLLACRTSTEGRVIGFGGGASHYPDGLYTVDSVGVVIIA